MYDRSTPSIDTVRVAGVPGWSCGIAGRGCTGIRIASKPSKNRATCLAQLQAALVVAEASPDGASPSPRITAPSGESSVLAAMWSSASAGMPVGERGEQQRRVDVRHLFQAERRAGIDVDAAARRLDRVDERRQHARRVGVDRAPRIVEPRRRSGSRRGRSPGSAAGRAATRARSSGRVRRARRVRARGRRPNAPSGRTRRCRPTVNVPGGPGMCPWPGTSAKLDLCPITPQ